MRLSLLAHRRREESAEALKKADYLRALELASEAQSLCRTERGKRLRILAEWLFRTTPECERFMEHTSGGQSSPQ